MKIRNTVSQSNDAPPEDPPRNLTPSLEENTTAIKTEFGYSNDLIIREFSFGNNGDVRAALVYLDGLVNISMINDNIIKPLMYGIHFPADEDSTVISGIDELKNRYLSASDVNIIKTVSEASDACLAGHAVLFVEDFENALEISVKGWEKRAITEPSTESVIRGPRESFIENIQTNTAMIRRKINNQSLKIKSMTIGQRTRTKVNIMYIDNLADLAVVKEVERRLKNIDTDAILSEGYIEQYIEDSPFSIFKTVWHSERPDAIAGKLLEGRVAVVVDGNPFVITVPMLFIESFQSPEDYNNRNLYASFIRIIRIFAFSLSITAPAIYVSLSTYHHELIPTALLFTMAAANDGVPFPPAIEAGIMMVTFEILHEAGIRMPRSVGQAVSIVGALVMGDAAVKAGMVSAPVVIVIAITAVSSYVVPFKADVSSFIRWILLILASIMGSFGITLGLFAILVHLTSLKSFGAYFFAPFAPFYSNDHQDSVTRAHIWAMRNRPRSIRHQDNKRQNFTIPYYPESTQGDKS